MKPPRPPQPRRASAPPHDRPARPARAAAPAAPATAPVRELHICGWQAVSALFARRPGEIIRLFFDAATGQRAGALCRHLAEHRKIYRQVPSADLEKIAGTVHHGGIVAVVAARPLPPVMPADRAAWARDRASLLLLDRVGNANNLGAIVRTAAFFGVRAVVLADVPGQALPGEAAWRVAEGGMEFVPLHRVPSLAAFCGELRASHTIIGACLRGLQLSPAAVTARGLPRPPALVLGNEEKGLSPAVTAACDRLVRIPGADTVESLNVSAAAAVLCWEFFGARR